MSPADLISIETLRSISTVLAFIAFIAICLWAYSGKRRDDFEQAANLPFADESHDYSLAKTPREKPSRQKISVREEKHAVSEKKHAVSKEK